MILRDTGRPVRHDTTKVHDTSRVHDTTKVHDTTRVHDRKKVCEREALGSEPASARPQRSSIAEGPSTVAPSGDQPAPMAPAAAEPVASAAPVMGPGGTARRTLSEVELLAIPVGDAVAPLPSTESTDLPAADRRTRTRLVETSLVVLGMLAAAAAITVWLVAGRPTSVAVDALELPPTAATWLENNIARDARLVVPHELQEEVEAALPGRVVDTYADAAGQPGDLVVVATGAETQAPDVVRRLVVESSAVAVLRPGLELRQVLDGRSAEQEQAARREAGRQLVAEIAVRLTPRAWSALAAGDVDPRLMGIIASISNDRTIDVAGFPRDEIERTAHAPARTMHVTAVDGRSVREGGATVEAIRTVLAEQPQPFRPDEVTLVSDTPTAALRVTVLLPHPAGLAPPSPSSSKETS